METVKQLLDAMQGVFETLAGAYGVSYIGTQINGTTKEYSLISINFMGDFGDKFADFDAELFDIMLQQYSYPCYFVRIIRDDEDTESPIIGFQYKFMSI